MTKPRTLVALLILSFFASAGFAWWWRTTDAAPASTLLHQATPPEVLAAVRDGAPHPLTVVNFWASWCEPCKREFPFFMRLRREFADAGVRVIFVSVDDGSDFDEAAQFLTANGVDFPTYYKGKQSLNFVADIFPNWSGAVPATVIFGPEGQVVESWEGDTTWANLERVVKRHLGGAS